MLIDGVSVLIKSFAVLNNQQNFNDRNDYNNVTDTSSPKIGKNMMVNRLTAIHGFEVFPY